MNVCFLIDSIYDFGGTQRITSMLANHLSQEGYNISIISMLKGGDEPAFFLESSVEVYSFYDQGVNISLRIFQLINKLNKLVKQNKIDILINVDTIQALFSLPLKLFNKNLKVISWEHFNYAINLGVKRRDYGRKLSLKYADAIVVLTNQDRELFIQQSPLRVNILCIPNFIESIPQETALLDNLTVLSLGRFTYQKAFDRLVDVWELVRKDSRSDDWTLQIAGNGEDKDNVWTKVRNLNLDDSIQILDATPHVKDLYLSSSIYVMSSRFEGLPMVLLEAKSYGLPIVSFDCVTGPRDLIENGKDGFLIEDNDNQSMANAILDLIGDLQKRKTFGGNSLSSSNRFMVENILPLWQKLFNEVI